jgi:purine-binding chemotaxis protein CheW
MEYATFYVAEDLFGIPIYLVQEIARNTVVYPIPGHDSRIEGLMNLRGRTTVVINLKRCLFKSDVKTAPGHRKKMIILETQDGLPREALDMGLSAGDEPVVLLIDDVYKIIDGERETFYPPPAHVNEAYIEGIMKSDEDLISLLSIPKLITDLVTFMEVEDHGS